MNLQGYLMLGIVSHDTHTHTHHFLFVLFLGVCNRVIMCLSNGKRIGQHIQLQNMGVTGERLWKNSVVGIGDMIWIEQMTGKKW